MLWGDRYAAFDWSGAKRGDPLFDYARTRVLLSMAEPPPGTQLTLRLLAKIGRRLLISSYVRSYERNTTGPVDEARVRQWEIVNLAVRMHDGIPGERPRLLRRLQQEFARGETVLRTRTPKVDAGYRTRLRCAREYSSNAFPGSASSKTSSNSSGPSTTYVSRARYPGGMFSMASLVKTILPA
jgi:hypothetical protein